MSLTDLASLARSLARPDKRTARRRCTTRRAPNAGLAPPPPSMSIVRPGRRHDSVGVGIGASRDRRNVKRPRTRNDIYHDEDDAGDATERERTSATFRRQLRLLQARGACRDTRARGVLLRRRPRASAGYESPCAYAQPDCASALRQAVRLRSMVTDLPL